MHDVAELASDLVSGESGDFILDLRCSLGSASAKPLKAAHTAGKVRCIQHGINR